MEGGGGGLREGRVESKRGEKMREGLNPGIKISELFFPPLSPPATFQLFLKYLAMSISK